MNDMNEQSGNSGQLPPDAGSGGDRGYNLSTSEGARSFIADYFAKELVRHDFAAYIKTRLAADFACALAGHLAARQPVGAEPTGWLCTWRSDGRTELREHPIYMEHPYNAGRWQCQPLYTAPPAQSSRQPVGVESILPQTPMDHDIAKIVSENWERYSDAPPAPAAVPVDGRSRQDAIDMDNGFRSYPWTYQNQPGNVGASALGTCARNAQPGGDSIDHGLSLLRELHLRGLGVVRVPALQDHPQPAAAKEPASFRFIAEEDRAPTRHDMRDRGGVGSQHKPSPTDEGAKR